MSKDLEKRSLGIIAGQEPVSPVSKVLLPVSGGMALAWLASAILPGSLLIWAIVMFVVGILAI